MGNSEEAATPKKPLEALEEHFSKVSDPRKDRTKEHTLIDIIAIAICVVALFASGALLMELRPKISRADMHQVFAEGPQRQDTPLRRGMPHLPIAVIARTIRAVKQN